MNLPMTAPIFPAGKEPLPPGITEEEREAYFQAKKYERWMSVSMESCVAKTAIAGAGGAFVLCVILKAFLDTHLEGIPFG